MIRHNTRLQPFIPAMQGAVECNLAGQEQLENRLAKFENWVKCSAELTSSTRRVYLSRLRRFQRFVEQHESAYLQEAFEEFLHELRSSARHPCTINNYITLFRRLCCLNEVELLDYSNASLSFIIRMSYKKPACVTRSALNEQERTRYILAAENRGKRALALAHLFLSTGIRLAECVNILLADLIYTESEDISGILVRGRAFQRIECVDEPLSQALSSWLAQRDSISMWCESPYLFPGRVRGLNTSAIDNQLRAIGIEANLVTSARVLRTTFLAEGKSA
jgi:site-specific recombinase XerD